MRFFAIALIAIALALASTASAQITFSNLISTANDAAADSDGCFSSSMVSQALTGWYSRCPFPLDGSADIQPDFNPSTGAGNGEIITIEGFPYAVINQRAMYPTSPVPNLGGVTTLTQFAVHYFEFSSPVFMPDNVIVITDLDYTTNGTSGFFDNFCLLVIDHTGTVTSPGGITPHGFENEVSAPTGGGVMAYQVAFPGTDVMTALNGKAQSLPNLSGITELTAYSNVADPNSSNPSKDPDGERNHDNENNGVSFDISSLSEGINGFIIIYWNTYQGTTNNEAGQGICVRDGEFTLESQITGDPHFQGFLGQKFNVLGEDQAIYNLISTEHIQYNARFNATEFMHKGKHASLISEMGVVVGASQVRLSVETVQGEIELGVEVNGRRIVAGDRTIVPLNEDGSEWVMRIPGTTTSAVIITDAYHFEVSAEAHRLPHLNDGVKLVDWIEGGNAHGLVGQTANPNKKQKDLNKEYVVDFEWPQYLDGNLNDYVVADGIFGSEFTFNHYEAL